MVCLLVRFPVLVVFLVADRGCLYRFGRSPRSRRDFVVVSNHTHAHTGCGASVVLSQFSRKETSGAVVKNTELAAQASYAQVCAL